MKVDIDAFPSVLIADRHLLPVNGGVYIVLNQAGDVEYIGQAANLRARWVQHHCAFYLDFPRLCSIFYIAIEDKRQRDLTEAALVGAYHPRININLNSSAVVRHRQRAPRAIPEECLGNPDLITVREVASIRNCNLEAARKFVTRRLKPVLQSGRVNYYSKKDVLDVKHYVRTNK